LCVVVSGAGKVLSSCLRLNSVYTGGVRVCQRHVDKVVHLQFFQVSHSLYPLVHCAEFGLLHLVWLEVVVKARVLKSVCTALYIHFES